MKVYKRSFFNSTTFKVNLFPVLFGAFLIFACKVNLAFWTWSGRGYLVLGVVLAFIVPILLSILSLLFYIELHNDKIVLVNGLSKFWRKKYFFSQYKFCRIEYNNGHMVNILKMRKVDKQNIFPYYGIDLVDPKDLKEIISILESKGVTVVTKDLREDL